MKIFGLSAWIQVIKHVKNRIKHDLLNPPQSVNRPPRERERDIEMAEQEEEM